MSEQLLKIADAAKRLCVGDNWVYERINRGEIPVVELGDTRKNQRIRESDLDSFITARTYGRTEVPMKTKEQALREVGLIVAEVAAIVRTLAPEQAAARAWRPDGLPMEELTEQIGATGLCRTSEHESGGGGPALMRTRRVSTAWTPLNDEGPASRQELAGPGVGEPGSVVE